MPSPPFAEVPAHTLPWLTGTHMREVDRRVEDVHGIGLAQMMENAGRALARLARTRFELERSTGSIVVLAGYGGNGGGALAAARHLHNWGFRVSVILSAEDSVYSGVPARQLATLASMRVPIATLAESGQHSVGFDPSEEDTPSLIIDGLIGYALEGDPRGPAAPLIVLANGATAPVLSLDVPSGLCATTGVPASPAVRANATLTLALPKQGLRESWVHTGDLFLADIGVPPAVYAEMDLDVPEGLFADSEILHVVGS